MGLAPASGASRFGASISLCGVCELHAISGAGSLRAGPVLAAGAGAAVDRLRMRRALEQENQPTVAGLDEGILSLSIPYSGLYVESLWVQYISVTNDSAPS